MTGKTHKAIGVSVGVAMTLYGAGQGMPLLALGMVTAPMGAMLPDIDHDNSKIGKKRKIFTAQASKIIKITAVPFVVLIGLVGYFNNNLLQSIFRLIAVVGPLAVCTIIANNPKIKSKSKFLRKHRGIMHTLLIPVCVILAAWQLGTIGLSALVIGLGLGYISHLLADCCTVAGCPVLWPITEKPMSILPIRTGSVQEYIMGTILAGGIIWIGFMLGI